MDRWGRIADSATTAWGPRGCRKTYRHAGLRAFIGRPVNSAPFGILICMRDGLKIDDPRVVPVSPASLLLPR